MLTRQLEGTRLLKCGNKFCSNPNVKLDFDVKYCYEGIAMHPPGWTPAPVIRGQTAGTLHYLLDLWLFITAAQFHYFERQHSPLWPAFGVQDLSGMRIRRPRIPSYVGHTAVDASSPAPSFTFGPGCKSPICTCQSQRSAKRDQ